MYVICICIIIYGWDKIIFVEKKKFYNINIFYIYKNIRLFFKDLYYLVGSYIVLIGKLINKYKYYGVLFINFLICLS